MEYRSFCQLSIIYYICSEDICWIWRVCFHCWFWFTVVVLKVIESLVYLDISYGVHVNHHHVLVKHDTTIYTEVWEKGLPLLPLSLFMVSFICLWLYLILVCPRHTVNTFLHVYVLSSLFLLGETCQRYCMNAIIVMLKLRAKDTRGTFIPINQKSTDKAIYKYDTDRQTNNSTQHTTQKTKI